MGELRVNDAVLRKMVATSDDPTGVIRGIDNSGAIRGSNNDVVNGGLGAAAEEAAGYFEEMVGIYAKRLEAYSKATKETVKGLASASQTDVFSFFSTQQKLIQMGSHPQMTA